MVFISACWVLAINLLADSGLEGGGRIAWGMLINDAALLLALTFGIALARHRAGGYHGSNGVWPFWRLAGAKPWRSLWPDIGLGLLVYPLIVWAIRLAELVNQMIMIKLHRTPEPHIVIQELARPQPAWVVAVFVVLATAGAAFLEELIFRGVLYNTLRRYLPAWFSACFAALIFASFHQGWSSFLGLFLLALVLTWLYDATGRLVASMTLHFINNLVAVLLVLNS